MPSVRMVLVGSESPATLPNFHKDLDVTLLSEIAEFALSLSTVKGQDTFSGLPHLQAYKLLRAYFLAEMGYVEAANRYVINPSCAAKTNVYLVDTARPLETLFELHLAVPSPIPLPSSVL